MSPFAAIRQRHLANWGRPVTLQRGTTVSIPTTAFFVQWSAEEIVNTDLRQGDMRIELLADLGEFPVPPRDPDVILTATTAYTVLFANPVYAGPELIGWTVAGRGA